MPVSSLASTGRSGSAGGLSSAGTFSVSAMSPVMKRETATGVSTPRSARSVTVLLRPGQRMRPMEGPS